MSKIDTAPDAVPQRIAAAPRRGVPEVAPPPGTGDAFSTMRALVKRLHEAQTKLLAAAPGSPRWRTLARSLQATVPPPILAHFLRSVGSGRPGVSLVRHGVCSVCHIRVPSALVPALIKPKDLHLCDQCSCYLLLPDDQVPPPAHPKAVRHAEDAHALIA